MKRNRKIKTKNETYKQSQCHCRNRKSDDCPVGQQAFFDLLIQFSHLAKLYTPFCIVR